MAAPSLRLRAIALALRVGFALRRRPLHCWPVSPRLLLSQYFSRDDEALDFARPFTDRAQFNVAIEFFGRIIFDESVAAVNLDAFVGDPHGHFPGIELSHRRLRRGLNALVLHPCGAMSEETCGIYF